MQFLCDYCHYCIYCMIFMEQAGESWWGRGRGWDGGGWGVCKVEVRILGHKAFTHKPVALQYGERCTVAACDVHARDQF